MSSIGKVPRVYEESGAYEARTNGPQKAKNEVLGAKKYELKGIKML